MNNPAIQRIVIVGGGLAGWTAAAGIATAVRGLQVSITVLDLPDMVNIEPVQYTIPATLAFFEHIGIDEVELIRQTGATFRVGTELAGWPRPGESRILGFGPYGADIGFVPFHHFVTKLRLDGHEPDYGDFSPNVVAARNGRFKPAKDEEDRKLPALAYGLHMNTDKLIQLLRTNAGINGVGSIEAQADAVNLHANGDVDAIVLQNGTQIGGDLFVDCSGERSLLIGEALDIDYIDWSAWLPCNRTASVTTKGPPAFGPLLHCTAKDEGWMVQSSLQHRAAHQMMFSSGYLDDERATEILAGHIGMSTADALTIGETRSGHRRQMWKANCVSLGAAAGSIEALNLSSFHLIQNSVTRLMGMLPGLRAGPALSREYNRATVNEYERLRDYTMLYYLAPADDSSTIRSTVRSAVKAAEPPDSLQKKIDLFASRGRLVADYSESISQAGWIAALLEGGIQPLGYDPMLDLMDDAQLAGHFWNMRAAIEEAVSEMPAHTEYLNKLIG